MTDSAQSISDLPGDIVQQCEDDSILGTCDWGDCNGEQAGWATSAADECSDGSCDWLAICAEHLQRGADQDYAITGSWTFAQVEAILGWPEGSIRDA